MKKFDQVIWAVKTAVFGGVPVDRLFKKYSNAKLDYETYDYRDKPRKQFVTNKQYRELEKLGAFED